MSFSVENFGKTNDDKEIHLIRVTNENGTVMELTDMGASWVTMLVKDKDGNMVDVVLGHSSGEFYQNNNGDQLGATVGRNANRISNHAFMLNGVKYELADNDSGANLHCGPDLYSSRLWAYEFIDDEEGVGVEFLLKSPDMDQGMPGNLDLSVSYVLTKDNSVVIEYNGICDKDTVVNLTNHSYFNLDGHKGGSIDEHELWVDANKATYSLTGNIADAKIYDIKGTPLDFSTQKKIGDCFITEYEPIKKYNGIDHNYCIDTDGADVKHIATLLSRESGIKMDVYSDRPGIQVYTGNWLNNSTTAKNGADYRKRYGVALETQQYPDAINHEDFPTPVIKANEAFNTCTVYKFSLV